MSSPVTIWVVEGEAAEASAALRDAGHHVVAGRTAGQPPQFLVADMAHLGPGGLGQVREMMAGSPGMTLILHHVWESHLAKEALGARHCHMLLDPVSSDDLLSALEGATLQQRASGLEADARVTYADLPSIPELVQPLVLFIVRECREAGLPEALLATAVPLCLTEALVNAVTHGNREIASRRVRLHYRVDSSEFRCSVSDSGDGFDPAAVPLPTSEENLLRDHGRGLFLIRHYMDEVTFNGIGNCITMLKRA